MVTGVLVGLLALGERMPASAAARATVLASWLAIALGVSGLANGPGKCYCTAESSGCQTSTAATAIRFWLKLVRKRRCVDIVFAHNSLSTVEPAQFVSGHVRLVAKISESVPEDSGTAELIR